MGSIDVAKESSPEFPALDNEQLVRLIYANLSYASILDANRLTKSGITIDSKIETHCKMVGYVAQGELEAALDSIIDMPGSLAQRSDIFLNLARLAERTDRGRQFVGVILGEAQNVLQNATTAEQFDIAIQVAAVMQRNKVPIDGMHDVLSRIDSVRVTDCQELDERMRLKIERDAVLGVLPDAEFDAQLESACKQLQHPDEMYASKVAPYGVMLFNELSERRGVEFALSVAQEIPYQTARIQALFGISYQAALINDEQFISIINTLRKELSDSEQLRFHDPNEYFMLHASFRQVYPAWLHNDHAMEIIAFGSTHFHALHYFTKDTPELLYMQKLEEQSFELRAVRTRMRQIEAEGFADSAMHESFDHWVSHAQPEFNQHVVSAYEKAEFNETGYVVLSEIIKNIATSRYEDIKLDTWLHTTIWNAVHIEGIEWDWWSMRRIVRNVAATGRIGEAHDLIAFITDPEQRILARTEMLSMYLDNTLQSTHNIWDSSVEIILKSLEDPSLCETAGWQSNALDKDKLRKLDIPITHKFAFLLGLSHHKDWKQEALTFAIELARKTNDQDALLYLTQHIALHHKGKFYIDKLFELSGYSSKEDYGTIRKISPHIIAGAIGLVQSGNEKGKGLALQLFANPLLGTAYPDMRRKLFSEFVDAKIISGDLKTTLEHRSIDGEVDEKYIEFCAYARRQYGVLVTNELLLLIEPVGALYDLGTMTARIDELYGLSESFNIPMNPLELFTSIRTHDMGLEAYYLGHNARRYATIAEYKLDSWKALVSETITLAIDPNRLIDFENHLIIHNFPPQERQTILDTLLQGRYPFADELRKISFHVPSDKELDDVFILENLQDLIRRKIWGFIQLSKSDVHLDDLNEETINELIFSNLYYDTTEGVNIDEYLFDFSEPISIEGLKRHAQSISSLPSASGDWQFTILNRLRSATDNSDHPYVKKAVSDIEKLLYQLEVVNTSEDEQSTDEFTMEFIEKGIDPVGFVRAVDAIWECVGTPIIDNHISYMPRRLVDPFSWTIRISDINSVVIGNVEMRLGINPTTQQMELMCVGLYSSKKTTYYVNRVMRFIEQSIARPFRLSAINIASINGGVITTPVGYTKTSTQMLGYSPVVGIDGTNKLFRGDDMYSGHWQNGVVDYNEEFPLEAFRKELRY